MTRRPSVSIAASTRRVVAALSLVQGTVFAWAAFLLPWRHDQPFTVLLTALAVLHLAVLLSGLFAPRRFPGAWRLQAYVGFGVLIYLAWVVGSSVSYIVSVYGRLGQGLGVALLAAFAPAVLLIVPTGAWALVATGRPGSRASRGVAALVLVGFGLEMGRWWITGRGERLAGDGDVAGFFRSLTPEDPLGDGVPPGPFGPGASGRTGGLAAAGTATRSPSLFSEEAVPCALGQGSAEGLLAAVTYTSRSRGAPVSACLSAGAPDALAQAILGRLEADAAGPRAKVDLLTRAQRLDVVPPLASPFVLRPGLDGACGGGRCLMPWQMVALDQFNAFKPLDFVPDLQLGVDPPSLRKRLGMGSSSPREPKPGSPGLASSSPEELGASTGPDHRAAASDPPGLSGVVRIATASFVRSDDGAWHRLERLRVAREPADGALVRRAAERAGAFVHRAQAGDGRFMYRIDPFAGTVSYGRFSIARQAGTTLALCELGDEGERTRGVAARSLGMLARLLQRSKARPEVGTLSYPAGTVAPYGRLGPNALALVAFATCRERLGLRQHDAVIATLGESLLTLMTPSGRFSPWLEMTAGVPVDAPFSLYADGQAVFALVLLEQLAEREPSALPRDQAVYGVAADRALRFYGRDYWRIPARDFFFVEENWHCLAARAALRSRRVDAYERFCLDYVRFKARLVLDERSGVRPDLVGGYHFSNITVPYTTPTAGFGEAAAAALAVAAVRGEELPEVKAALRRSLDFLVHTQWTEVACFACTERIFIPGGFSESLTSPTIRIDYVQHAWAALGHGGRALGLIEG